MKPIKFEGYNLILAEDQPEYLPLPVDRDSEGLTISCWKLSWKERFKILFTGVLWIQQLTFKSPLQPIAPSVETPFATP